MKLPEKNVSALLKISNSDTIGYSIWRLVDWLLSGTKQMLYSPTCDAEPKDGSGDRQKLSYLQSSLGCLCSSEHCFLQKKRVIREAKNDNFTLQNDKQLLNLSVITWLSNHNKRQYKGFQP